MPMISRAFLELRVLIRSNSEVKGIHMPSAWLWKGSSWWQWMLLPGLPCQKERNFFQSSLPPLPCKDCSGQSQQCAESWVWIGSNPAVLVLPPGSNKLWWDSCGGIKESLDHQWLIELTVCLNSQGQNSALGFIRHSCGHFLSRWWRAVMESCHTHSMDTATLPARAKFLTDDK